MDIEIVEASPIDPDAVGLIAELNELLDGLYRPDDNHFALDPTEVTEGRGLFLVARRGGVPMGCGALRMTADGRGEIKRMYVRPQTRGQGVGRNILTMLEAEARRLGATALVLEMGDSQPQAHGLYTRAGFSPIPCWAGYLATPASICLGKDL
ncbi:GNAT family N-acetyltransferase [soil metagenome]